MNRVPFPFYNIRYLRDKIQFYQNCTAEELKHGLRHLNFLCSAAFYINLQTLSRNNIRVVSMIKAGFFSNGNKLGRIDQTDWRVIETSGDSPNEGSILYRMESADNTQGRVFQFNFQYLAISRCSLRSSSARHLTSSAIAEKWKPCLPVFAWKAAYSMELIAVSSVSPLRIRRT